MNDGLLDRGRLSYIAANNTLGQLQWRRNDAALRLEHTVDEGVECECVTSQRVELLSKIEEELFLRSRDTSNAGVAANVGTLRDIENGFVLPPAPVLRPVPITMREYERYTKEVVDVNRERTEKAYKAQVRKREVFEKWDKQAEEKGCDVRKILGRGLGSGIRERGMRTMDERGVVVAATRGEEVEGDLVQMGIEMVVPTEGKGRKVEKGAWEDVYGGKYF
jgi:hypothetical protein